MTKMKKFMITLSALSVACLGVAIANVSPVNGAAETTLEANKNGIFMNSGAAVRFDSEDTTGKKNGIRYELLLTETAYANIKNGYEEATFGVLIAPASYEDTAELNYAHVFGEEAVYDWAEWDSELGKYVYNGTGEKTRIINVSTTVDFETVNLTTTVIENVTYYHYYGSMTNVNESNLGREFVGVGYVQATYTAAAEEGAEAKTVTDTYFAEDNDNVRSMAYVAQQAIKDTSDKNKLDGDAKAWLQQNYVDKVADAETTYTLEYRVPTNVVAGDTAVIHTETVTANVDETVDVVAPALDGYNCVAAADSVHVLANGKSKVVVNCTYVENFLVQAQGIAKGFTWSGDRFYYLTEENAANRTFGAVTGIFYNTTDAETTITASGNNGATAIYDANGRLVQGIDNGNNRIIDMDNPVPHSSSKQNIAINTFSSSITIPANGFALMAQNSKSDYVDFIENGNVAAEAAVSDIRAHVINNFMPKYNACMQISIGDKALTKYDGAEYYITAGYIASANIKHASSDPTKTLSAGAKVYATNGVFATSYEEVTANATFATAASSKSILTTAFTGQGNRKTVQLTATVNGVTTTFYRALFEVKDVDVTISIGENVFTIAAASKTTEFAINQQETTNANFHPYSFRLYSYDFWNDTTRTNFTKMANGWGVAMVLDNNGKVLRIYSGATGSALYYDKDNNGTSTQLGAGTNNVDAMNSLQNGEYLLLAPNNADNNTETGSRTFMKGLLSQSTIGLQVSISYYDL